MRALIIVITLALVSGCGFQLRGQAKLPFDTLYIDGFEGTPLVAELKRVIKAGSRTRITDRPDDAQAVLYVTRVSQEKKILSLSGTGRVREFQILYHVGFRVSDGNATDYIPASELVLRRDYSFNDTEIESKETEELLLYRDMQSDAVQQIMRRLGAVKI